MLFWIKCFSDVLFFTLNIWVFCYKNILYWMYNMIVNIDSLICKNSADFPECRKWNIWYLFWLLLTIKFNYFIRFSALGHKIHFYNFKYQGILKSLFFDNADNTFWFYSLPIPPPNPINLYSPNFKIIFPQHIVWWFPVFRQGYLLDYDYGTILCNPIQSPIWTQLKTMIVSPWTGNTAPERFRMIFASSLFVIDCSQALWRWLQLWVHDLTIFKSVFNI